MTTRRGGRRALPRWLFAGAAGVSLLGAACSPPRSARQPTISLRMGGTPPDAAVIIDDESIGQLDFVAARGVALPPGLHHLTVKASGYFPWDKEVTAQPGSPPIHLVVALTRVPD